MQKWNILMKWTDAGYIKSLEQGKRVVDRLVKKDTKSPFVEKYKKMSEIMKSREGMTNPYGD